MKTISGIKKAASSTVLQSHLHVKTFRRRSILFCLHLTFTAHVFLFENLFGDFVLKFILELTRVLYLVIEDLTFHHIQMDFSYFINLKINFICYFG